MKKIISTLLVSFLLLFGYVGYSQGCAEPTSDEGVVLFGFLQPQYDHNFTEDPGGTFRFNRMRIGVMGNIPYDFSYYALIEASPFFNGAGQMFLLDAFVSYNRFDFARVSVGQFKKPLGLELITPCSGLNTINRSEVVNELTGPTNRDMGLMILGGDANSMISYRLAIMNGSGVNTLNEDNFMDYYGRVDFQPIKGVTLGGSMMFGRDRAENENAGNDERWRYGADINVNFRNFILQSEYLYGNDIGSYTTGGGCDGGAVEYHQGSIERDGFFVMAMYNVTSQIQPVIKYEEFNSNKEAGNLLNQTTTFGLNYFFNDWTRLQINYLYKAEDPTEVQNDCLLMQVQVKF
jgi:hypothetical protein